jgi:hypothetical protein
MLGWTVNLIEAHMTTDRGLREVRLRAYEVLALVLTIVNEALWPKHAYLPWVCRCWNLYDRFNSCIKST